MKGPQSVNSAIVLFAHGARDPEWRLPFERIREQVVSRNPGVAVELAFLEFMRPTLADAVSQAAASGVGRVTLVPLFLAQGGHLKHDLPHLMEDLRRRFPGLQVRVTRAIGDVDPVLAAMVDWICEEHRA